MKNIRNGSVAITLAFMLSFSSVSSAQAPNPLAHLQDLLSLLKQLERIVAGIFVQPPDKCRYYIYDPTDGRNPEPVGWDDKCVEDFYNNLNRTYRSAKVSLSRAKPALSKRGYRIQSRRLSKLNTRRLAVNKILRKARRR